MFGRLLKLFPRALLGGGLARGDDTRDDAVRMSTSG